MWNIEIGTQVFTLGQQTLCLPKSSFLALFCALIKERLNDLDTHAGLGAKRDIYFKYFFLKVGGAHYYLKGTRENINVWASDRLGTVDI